MIGFDKLCRFPSDKAVVVAPDVNIYEQEQGIVLEVDIPGASRDSLSVDLQNSILVIRGSRKKEEVSKEYRSVYVERTAMDYERKFEINSDVDREKVQATYENGVLKIVLPKTERALPKKVEIKG